MNSITSWLIAVLSVVIFTYAFDILLSESHIKKMVTGMMRIAVMLVVLAPVLSFLHSPFDISEGDTVISTTDILFYEPIDFEKEFAENKIKTELARKNIPCNVVLLIDEENKIRSVNIYLKDFGIIPSEGNIYSNSQIILDTVQKNVEVEITQIFVYGDIQ